MKSTLRILCLEDDHEDFEIINYILQSSGLSVESHRVETKEDFIEALSNYNADVILSDHSLPLFDSTEALKICQDRKLHIPFILVTGAVSDEFAVSCIKMGADDYVLKSNLARLPSAIENSIKHKETEKAKLKAISSLETQNEKLIKINKELDRVVYSVSHNLRAPLMSVLGLLTLAKKEDNNEALLQYHTLMESSIQKLDDTLKEILEYSRNARQELKIERIDLKNLIQDSLDKMKFLEGFDRLNIEISMAHQAEFFSDFYRLSVILANLISNAIKYVDHRKEKSFFKIDVAVDEHRARFVFDDNGIGIDQRLIPKIFDMFFRATDTKEGSGLGLYIVKEAIDILKGKINIQSVFGRGTTFTVEIPNNVRANGSVTAIRKSSDISAVH